MEEQYGFDATFISEVPDYLKCIICHLVLRQPIQIMKCGHRFCEPCFERLKGYSQHLNSELCCPVDMETINLYKVFDDTVIDRVIRNLKVKCVNHEISCTWTGDLRDLKTHEDQCQHRCIEILHDQSKKIQESECEDGLLKLLYTRMDKYEDEMKQKEKDVTFLKENLCELKRWANEKDNEVATLKVSNLNIRNDMKSMTEENRKVKSQLESEIDMLKNQLLERNQLVDSKNLIDEYQMKMKTVMSEVEEIKKCISLPIEHINVESNDNHPTEKPVQITTIAMQVTTNEIALIDNMEILKEKFDKINEEINLINNWQKQVAKTKSEVEDLVSHVENVENIIFCDYYCNNGNVKLKWILNDYDYYFHIGKMVHSPVFYTQINGYAFQLVVTWCGIKGEDLGLYLLLHRKCNDKPLEPFRMQYTFEINDKEGNRCYDSVLLPEIDNHRDQCFTIHDNEHKVRKGYGGKFLSMPSLQNYIINDRLTIYCTLEPVR